MNHRVNRLGSVLGALVVLAVLADLPAAAGAEAQRGVSPAAAAEPPDLDAPGVTPERLSKLPAADQPRWHAYLDRSTALAKADRSEIQAEAAMQPTNQILKAPNGSDFKLPARTGDGWYASDDARRLADIILSYQTRSGGWSKHTGYSKGPRQPGMQWTSQNEPGKPAHYVATFDNRSTTEQLHFLANVWLATKRDEYQVAFVKGLNYILAAQYPNGGWPQVYPLEGGYHDSITYNDDAITHILQILQAITNQEPQYAFLTDAQRRQAAGALAAGLRCVLQTQVTIKGQKTVWCAQSDPLTFRPAPARKLEPASLSGGESAHLLQFLMTIPHPSPEIIAAIESALTWFDRAKLSVTKVNQNGKTIYEPTAAPSEPTWARFYDLNTGKPIFPGRDGVIYATFEAMAARNKVGYDYYTTQPYSIITNGQKKWRKMLAQAQP